MNKQRTTEIRTDMKTVEQLKCQISAAKLELGEAIRVKNYWQEKMELASKKKRQKPIINLLSRTKDGDGPPGRSATKSHFINLPNTNYCRAPIGTMSEVLTMLSVERI